MIGMEDLDYYHLLEIPRNATTAEITHAYRLSQQTYGEGSLALYSIFESSEAAVIRERLDEAYRVLSNPEFRAAYDVDQPPAEVTAYSLSRSGEHTDESRPDLATNGATSVDSAGASSAIDSLEEGVEEYDVFEDEGGGEFDGVRLRRTRLFRGYEIDDIADVTKVSGSHLRNIEDENFVDLPADVYVRGFVTAYATTIGLDPNIVVPSYMARVQESRSGNQRGRFLGRS